MAVGLGDVMEGGDGFGFGFEAVATGAVDGEFRGKEFEGDCAVKAGVFGLVTSPIPPLPIRFWIS